MKSKDKMGPRVFKRLKKETVKKNKVHRDQVLQKQLDTFGKVGGFKDARLGVRDSTKSPKEAYFQRHMVEKMRQVDRLILGGVEEDDPLIKAAADRSSSDFLINQDDDELELEGDVTEQFFVEGLKDRTSGSKFKDNLEEKIAATKLQRIEKVEQNAHQRELLKEADSAWTHSIRFMLSAALPTKNKKLVSANASKNVSTVTRLLEEVVSSKRIPPVDAVVASEAEKFEKKIIKLQSLISNKNAMHSEASTEIRNNSEEEGQSDDSDYSVGNKCQPKKSASYFLRLLLKMPEQTLTTFSFIADTLHSAKFRKLKDVIHHLMLAQVLLTHCQETYTCSKAVTDSLNMIQESSKPGSGVYSSELVHLLNNILMLAISADEINLQSTEEKMRSLLMLKRPRVGVALSEFDHLSVEWADQDAKLPKSQISRIKLASLYRLIVLCSKTHELYTGFLSSSVSTQLFSQTENMLSQLPLSYYPPELVELVHQLIDRIQASRRAPNAKPLTASLRLSVLSDAAQSTAEARDLQKLGLLPQLEPRFDEKLDARRHKETNPHRSLQRKVTREKRGAMREIRRDSQFLAARQLQVAKANDVARKKKTQAIINSIRSIDD